MSETDKVANGQVSNENNVPDKNIIITKSIKSLTAQTNNVVSDNVENSKNQENINTEKISDSLKTPAGNNLSEAEKLELRIKKFGVQSENAKKDIRAQRFGISNSEGPIGKDQTALDKRAQRFGTVPSTPTSGVTKDANLLEKRAKRFGNQAETTTATPASNESNEALLKRKQRFGGVDDEDTKKKLRSQRFENQV